MAFEETAGKKGVEKTIHAGTWFVRSGWRMLFRAIGRHAIIRRGKSGLALEVKDLNKRVLLGVGAVFKQSQAGD